MDVEGVVQQQWHNNNNPIMEGPQQQQQQRAYMKIAANFVIIFVAGKLDIFIHNQGGGRTGWVIGRISRRGGGSEKIGDLLKKPGKLKGIDSKKKFRVEFSGIFSRNFKVFAIARRSEIN